MKDNELFWIFSGLFGFLAVATVIGLILKQVKGNTSVISNLNARIRAWWLMCIIAAVAISIAHRLCGAVCFYVPACTA